MADELSIRISLAYASGGETLFSKNVAVTQDKINAPYESSIFVTSGTANTAELISLPAGNARYVLFRNLSEAQAAVADDAVIHVHTSNTSTDGDSRICSIPPGGVALFPVGVTSAEATGLYGTGAELAADAGGTSTLYINSNKASTSVEYVLLRV